jgi:hypothetical protein
MCKARDKFNGIWSSPIMKKTYFFSENSKIDTKVEVIKIAGKRPL